MGEIIAKILREKYVKSMIVKINDVAKAKGYEKQSSVEEAAKEVFAAEAKKGKPIKPALQQEILRKMERG